ncbi:hypothetical protein JHK82_053016 [Glycine max]|nr:hypothetical protein JHK86_052861 [Glycine max]KAG4927233.1 hypothetical protein JHK85_053719 [Glycine max]KAG5082851.1 hypothetical protein JHK84_052889 [Glycine max]KAG5085619.1 hypothetical protein JHK82_053016 [Glycine max]
MSPQSFFTSYSYPICDHKPCPLSRKKKTKRKKIEIISIILHPQKEWSVNQTVNHKLSNSKQWILLSAIFWTFRSKLSHHVNV